MTAPPPDPLAEAHAFLVRHLSERRPKEQERVEDLLRHLTDVQALVLALESVAGEEAAAHRIACAAERARTIAALSAILAAWTQVGGRLVLAPPEVSVRTAPLGISERSSDVVSVPALMPEPTSTAESLPESASPPAISTDLIAAAAQVIEPQELLSVNASAAPAPKPEPVQLDQGTLLRLQAHYQNPNGAPFGAATAAGAIDPRTAGEHLRALVRDLTLPPDGVWMSVADWEQAVSVVSDYVSFAESVWPPLPKDWQRDLTAFFAAYARALQDVTPDNVIGGFAERLSSVFSYLSLFSRTYRPGVVHGLARMHQPQGETWLDDARTALVALRAAAGMSALALPVPLEKPGAPRTSQTDIEIAEFLRDQGFITPEAQKQARAVLERLELTQPRKQRISREKLDRARTAFKKEMLRVCDNPACTRLRRDFFHRAEHPVVVEHANLCGVCHGSNNQRAATALKAHLAAAGLTHLLIVGGSDDTRTEVDLLLDGDGLEVRQIDGTRAQTLKVAKEQMNWADVVVVWGSSELDHKVSNLYKAPPPGHRLVTLHKRGIEAMCNEVIERVPFAET